MTLTKAVFEPISLITLKKEEISPITPGFADSVTINDTKQDYKVLSNKEIETIKQTCWQEGYDKATSEIDRESQKLQELQKEALSNLVDKFQEIIPLASDMKTESTELMFNIALKTAKKIVGDMIGEHEEAFITRVIEKALTLLTREPSVTIRTNPKLKDIITSSISELKSKTNFKGDIIYVEDNHLHEINCLVEWQDGIIESNNDIIWESLEKIISSENTDNEDPTLITK